MDSEFFEPTNYTLIDEEGIEHQFELLDSLEENGITYYAMTPVLSDPQALEDSDGELIILKGETHEGEEVLVTIDNEEEHDRIGNCFLERFEKIWSEIDQDDLEQI